jgi:uncharacterized protein
MSEAPVSLRLLLDVNVWIALFDESHIHNARARQLFENKDLKIASCPLIENSVIRIAAMPGIRRVPSVSLQTVRKMMQQVIADVDHEFWSADVSLLKHDVLDWSRISGHNQITDAYLLALAVRHAGALTSFDQRIALSSVKNAQERHLLLL